ncbi:MAG: class I SAM-dependent methyltransferase [Thiobacillaceae bacterium]
MTDLSVNVEDTPVEGKGDANSRASSPRSCAFEFLTQLGKKIINPGGIEGRDRMLDLIRPSSGSRVLVIGGGSAHTACHIAITFGCKVTALDFSAGKVAAAEEWVSRLGLTGQVHCTLADITQLPFAEDSFDYVVTQAVLMIVPHPMALWEVRRVLKEKGVFAGLEFCWGRMPTEQMREATRAVCGCRSLDFHTLYGWIATLRDARFESVQATEHPCRLLNTGKMIQDEGWVNSLKIAGKLLIRRADRTRFKEIKRHLSTHQKHLSYVVFAGKKLSLPKVRSAQSEAASQLLSKLHPDLEARLHTLRARRWSREMQRSFSWGAAP